jgi:cytochrome c biogenesis protein CcdA
LGVFVTYTLVGAGLLGGLRRIALEAGARRILEAILGGGLIVLAVLSLIDAHRLRQGRSDIILKLPESVSRRIHGLIRNRARSGALLGGALVLGAVVAFLELGCTGQVYLPTIAWMISRGGEANAWVWLLIYNSAFILPLLGVFVISYRGISASRMARVFKERAAGVKIATAGLFIAMAVLVWIT